MTQQRWFNCWRTWKWKWKFEGMLGTYHVLCHVVRAAMCLMPPANRLITVISSCHDAPDAGVKSNTLSVSECTISIFMHFRWWMIASDECLVNQHEQKRLRGRKRIINLSTICSGLQTWVIAAVPHLVLLKVVFGFKSCTLSVGGHVSNCDLGPLFRIGQRFHHDC